MTHLAYESNLRSVVRSFMHPYPENWLAFWRAVVWCPAAQASSAGIKCRHCRSNRDEREGRNREDLLFMNSSEVFFSCRSTTDHWSLSTGRLPVPCLRTKARNVRSIVRSPMQLCPGNMVAIGPVVLYYARVAHSFSAGIKCRHCT